VKVQKRTTCRRLSSALPRPRPGDGRAIAIRDVLTTDLSALRDRRGRRGLVVHQVFDRIASGASAALARSIPQALQRLDALA
jgi:hypothetical protein